ncbi:acyl-CoA dehydrogenase family protein [Pseudooceanicola sp. CBS1P-1]|uniref:Diaminopimelate decarboxylase n=2 Tax=Paracoccaceae TaxID=31989 RepID=A0A6L7G8A7_9RHOB|nr:acyl-CoA dehydrogenase family protein [Pseudooceanicola endophyticus]MXN20285.1 diaminopimelate decarboxylase [Pseudooceanicola albus]
MARAAGLFGTPFYLYDGDALRARVAQLRTALPGVAFFYSLKANPNLSVVSRLIAAGAGAEVCSRLELETALAAGAPPDRILMVGPAKSADELARAVDLGIAAIVADSLDELEEIDALARARGTVQPVALRINPDFSATGARLSMGGRATQFGLDQPLLPDTLTALRALPGLRLAGLHVYMGTRILSPEVIAANTRQILALADEMLADGPLDFVDVGGGFGVAYHEGEVPLDLAAVAGALNPMIRAFRARHPGTRVAIELGRYMVAEAGIFVTRIRRNKRTKGEQFAICDGGSNLHAAAAGQGFMRRNFPISLHDAEGQPRAGTPERWSATGPLCTPMDVIASGIELPAPRPDDLLCLHHSGAYGPSASPTDFLGFGAPAEVIADGDRLSLASPAPRWQERLSRQQPLSAPPSAAPLVLPAPFDHPALARLDGLRALFERTGARLEEDPAACADLWQEPLVRALTTIGVPEAFNGFPLSQTPLGLSECPYPLHVAMIERLARMDASCILALQGPSLSGGAVLAMGTPDQQARFFAPWRDGPQGTFFAVTEPEVGSDASAGRTRIDTDSEGRMWLSGEKMLVGNIARSSVGLVFAHHAGSRRAALVLLEMDRLAREIQNGQLGIARLPTNGLRGADLARITMERLPIDPGMILGDGSTATLRDGFMAINGVFERNRPVVAALALGNGRGILDRLAIAGATGFADLERRHLALLHRLAGVLEDYAEGRPRAHRISQIKLQAVAFSDALAARIPARAPQALLADPLLRRKMRDARAFEYMEGTSSIHLLNAFRAFAAQVPA